MMSPFDPHQLVDKSERHLPHWRQDGAIYFVTFRLGDSLPQPILDQWRRAKEVWKDKHPPPRTRTQEEEYRRLFNERMDTYLDSGHGDCWLGRPPAQDVVEHALRHFDAQRYVLGRFAIMPNHVHVLVNPLPGYELSKILHSWKSYTSNEINKASHRVGTLWQDESFDHIVRGEDQLRRFEAYIIENPSKAGLNPGQFRLG